jgi:hypothetical protein
MGSKKRPGRVIVISFLFLVLSAYFTRGKINNTNRRVLLGKKIPCWGVCVALKKCGGVVRDFSGASHWGGKTDVVGFMRKGPIGSP